MDILFLLFSFVFGTIIGSFLNVVALRFNTGMTLGGRSRCFSCGKDLFWYELIPLFSFLFQKGSCTKCGSKISYQYPTVEFITGVLFTLIIYFYPPVDLYSSVHTLFYLIITGILIVISIYDIKHKIIPDSLSYSFAIIAFLHMFISKDLSIVIPHWYDLLSGPILAFPLAFLWVISKGKWLGLGDVKLLLGVGFTLGLFDAISSFILSFWIGAFMGILWMYIVHKKLKRGYEIPFGPYIIVSMYIILFTGIKIIDIGALLSI